MQIYISPKALNQLGNFPRDDQERIVEKLRFYATQVKPLVFVKPIRDKRYRFRIGNYRIIFLIQNSIIHIGKIEWRDKVYD